MVERERQFADRTENETSYYIGSLANNAEKYLNATRRHPQSLESRKQPSLVLDFWS